MRRRVVAAAIAEARTIESGQGVAGSWLPGGGVVARVSHDAAGARGRAEHDVLAEHHGIDPRGLGLDGDAHERPQVAW
jgi:hypothetical protein